MGHVARMDEERIPRRLLGVQRALAGRPGRGNAGESLLGVYGRDGTLLKRIAEYFETTGARRRFFGGARGTVPWFKCAEDRNAWWQFVRSLALSP